MVACRLLNAERTIAEHFPDGRCVNVSWSVLLALYASHREKRKLDVSGVCFAVPAPTTTVLRRIDRLAHLGLVERVPDKADRRSTLVALKPDALKDTEACLGAIGRLHDLGNASSRESS